MSYKKLIKMFFNYLNINGTGAGREWGKILTPILVLFVIRGK